MLLRVVRSHLVSPYVHQALEEHLVRELVQESTVAQPKALLFLRRNAPCVVIGRNQHALSEVDISALRRDKVVLLRRKTGGGCVYQDLGNANYTLVRPDGQGVRASNNAILVDALQTIGVPNASASGRNDLVVDKGAGDVRKVSGAAFRLEGTHMVHHGTVLVATQLAALARYLTPSRIKLAKHGVASVSSRVCNLADVAPNVTVDRWDDALEQATIDHLRPSSVERVHIHVDERHMTIELQMSTLAYADPRWVMGEESEQTASLQTTLHEHRFSWGIVTAHVSESKESRVHSILLFSDSLAYQLLDDARMHLAYVCAQTDPVTRDTALATFVPTLQAHAEMARELHTWLASTRPVA
jgi:lipoate-protein ligase A